LISRRASTAPVCAVAANMKYWQLGAFDFGFEFVPASPALRDQVQLLVQ
jgi:hypothetical protein